MRLVSLAMLAILALIMSVGCSQQRANPPAKDNVEKSLKQNGMDKINVDENRDKGVITLKGDVKSDEVKRQAGELAQAAAPGRVVANELAVRPEGAEGTAKKIDTNVDDAIEDNFKAVIAAKHWDNQHIRFNAKNGVLTLKGDVDTPTQRAEAERAAAKVPGVKQVVNKLDVKGKK
jgi:hyperosmotically inducible periplasmic protein